MRPFSSQRNSTADAAAGLWVAADRLPKIKNAERPVRISFPYRGFRLRKCESARCAGCPASSCSRRAFASRAAASGWEGTWSIYKGLAVLQRRHAQRMRQDVRHANLFESEPSSPASKAACTAAPLATHSSGSCSKGRLPDMRVNISRTIGIRERAAHAQRLVDVAPAHARVMQHVFQQNFGARQQIGIVICSNFSRVKSMRTGTKGSVRVLDAVHRTLRFKGNRHRIGAPSAGVWRLRLSSAIRHLNSYRFPS